MSKRQYVEEVGSIGYLVRQEALSIAEYLWRNHYAEDAPNWKPFGDTRGILSQIDNMVAGLCRTARAQAAEAALAERERQIEEALQTTEGASTLQSMAAGYIEGAANTVALEEAVEALGRVDTVLSRNSGDYPPSKEERVALAFLARTIVEKYGERK